MKKVLTSAAAAGILVSGLGVGVAGPAHAASANRTVYGYTACEQTLTDTLRQYRSYGYTPTNIQRCFSRFSDGWWSFSFDYGKKSNNG